jgi:hypothetical protein
MDLLTFLTLLDEHPEAVLSFDAVEPGRRNYTHVRCIKAWVELMQAVHANDTVGRFAERYAIEIVSKQGESDKCASCGEPIRWTY